MGVRVNNMDKETLGTQFMQELLPIISDIAQEAERQKRAEHRARLVKDRGIKFEQPKPFMSEKDDNRVQLVGILEQLLSLGYNAVRAVAPRKLIALEPTDTKPLELNLPIGLEVNLFYIIGKGDALIESILSYGNLKKAKLQYDCYRTLDTSIKCVAQHKPNRLSAIKTVRGGDYILTLNGFVKTNPGDWIITGVNGEQYPCDPEIFKQLYDIYDIVE